MGVEWGLFWSQERFQSQSRLFIQLATRPDQSMKGARRIANSPLVIFLAAVCTRLAATLYMLKKGFAAEMLFVGNEPSHIAAALASGLGFSAPYAHTPIAPTAQQPPLYPLILAAIFKVFGIYTAQSAWVIVALHIVAGGLTAILIYRLGKLYFGETVGIVGAWLWVLPWMFRVRPFAVSSTNAYLAALGFAAFLLWLPRVMKENRGWFLIGAYAGLLLLLQTAFLSVFLVYGSWLALSKARSLRMWLAVAGILVVVSPWMARNYIALGRVTIRDNFGLELWLGNHPGMEGTLDYSRDFPGLDPSNYIQLGETNFMDTKFREARDFITSNPRAFLGRCLRRAVEFWHVPYPVSWILFFALGWIGAAFAWKTNRLSWLLVIPLAVFPLVYYATHSFASYRYPIEPVIILLAAYAVVELISHAHRNGLVPFESRRFGSKRGTGELDVGTVDENQPLRS
jgi:4-amino-4-deoxy-L-arabinose transferase-like glycosyltransferase